MDKMEFHCKHISLPLFFICLVFSNCVSEEITAKEVYKLISYSIFEMKVDMQNMKRQIENIEQKVRGITTTVSSLVETTLSLKEEEFYDLKEELNLEALAIQKSLTEENVLLREAVNKLEVRFDEMKSEIQKDMSSINESLEGKAQAMLDIVTCNISTIAKDIAENPSILNHTTENLCQILETMETKMMSYFENLETRMITNVTELQSETQESLRSVQTDMGFLSANVSSVTLSLTDRISNESSSLASRIDTVTSSLTSQISEISNQYLRISSEITSLSSRISREEDRRRIAFSACVDHEVRNLGKDQIVQFRYVLLNDGYAFNSNTGIFTAPYGGVYLMSFFVEDYHDFQSIIHLVGNYEIITSAIVDPIPWGQNVQGGNVIFVRLNAGDRVWVSAGVAGVNIEGYSTLRTSTFSGHYLYA